MFRIALLMTMIPVAITGLHLAKPMAPPALIVKAQYVEPEPDAVWPVHSFTERWDAAVPVRMTKADRLVRDVAQGPGGQRGSATIVGPVPGATVAQQPRAETSPRYRRISVKQQKPKNVCEQHGMRKVVTRGGKSWRCR